MSFTNNSKISIFIKRLPTTYYIISRITCYQIDILPHKIWTDYIIPISKTDELEFISTSINRIQCPVSRRGYTTILLVLNNKPTILPAIFIKNLPRAIGRTIINSKNHYIRIRLTQ